VLAASSIKPIGVIMNGFDSKAETAVAAHSTIERNKRNADKAALHIVYTLCGAILVAHGIYLINVFI